MNLFKIKNIFEKTVFSQYWSLLRNIQILFWRGKYDLLKHHIDQSEGVKKFIGLRSNQLFCLAEEILNRKLHKNDYTEFIGSDKFFRHPLYFVRSKFINNRGNQIGHQHPESVTNISNLSPTHLVSNIRLQHRCNHLYKTYDMTIWNTTY